MQYLKNYKNAGYLFYETTRGFNFRSFESLMALSGTTARPVTEVYSMQPPICVQTKVTLM